MAQQRPASDELGRCLLVGDKFSHEVVQVECSHNRRRRRHCADAPEVFIKVCVTRNAGPSPSAGPRSPLP